MSKKILFLSLSCNDPFFQALLGAVKDTWARPLIQNKYPDIIWFAYTACDKHHPNPCVDFQEHIIYVDCPDDLEHTYTKTKLAYNMIKDVCDFDFVVRTNTSLYVNIDNLIDRVNRLTDDMVMSRWMLNTDYEHIIGQKFWQMMGYFMVMSRDYFETCLTSDGDYIVTEQSEIQTVDDHIMAYNLISSLKPIVFANINDTPSTIVYYYGDYEDSTPNDIHTLNPDIINDAVMVRVRPIDTFVRKDCMEIKRLYELHNALK